MPLSGIKLPADDARLIQYEDTVFKVKLTYDAGDGSAFLPCSRGQLNHQVEQVLRAVLHQKEFETFKVKTEHFYVDCSQYKWEALRLIAFKKDNIRLQAHPSVLALRFRPHGLHTSNGDVRATQENVQQTRRHQETEEAIKGQLRKSPRIHRPTKGKQRSQAQESTDLRQGIEERSPRKKRGEKSLQGEGGRPETDLSHRVHSERRRSRINPISDSSEEESAEKKKSKQRKRKRYMAILSDSSTDTELEESREKKKPMKKAHKLPLQFVNPPSKVLHINLGERLGDEKLIRHHVESNVINDDPGSGDHRRQTSRASRVEINLGGGGEDGRKSRKQNLTSHRPRSRSSSPLHVRGHRRPISNEDKNPLRTHNMTTRPKPKTPPQVSRRRRRSSFSGYLETFLDDFW